MHKMGGGGGGGGAENTKINNELVGQKVLQNGLKGHSLSTF